MSLPLDVLVYLCTILPPDQRILFRVNRYLFQAINDSILRTSKGFFLDCLEQGPSSLLLLQLKANPLLVNTYQEVKVRNGVLSLHPLQCTASPRLLKLMLTHGADIDPCIAQCCPQGVLASMVSQKRWDPNAIQSLGEAYKYLLDYAGLCPRHDLLTLLLEAGSRGGYVNHGFNMPLIRPRLGESVLSLILDQKGLHFQYHTARGLAIAILFWYGPEGLPTLIIKGDRIYRGKKALNLLCLKHEVSGNLLANDEVVRDPRDCIFPNPLPLKAEDGHRIYIQSPPEYMADYMHGVGLALRVSNLPRA